jgi:hypothetical protein
LSVKIVGNSRLRSKPDDAGPVDQSGGTEPNEGICFLPFHLGKGTFNVLGASDLDWNNRHPQRSGMMLEPLDSERRIRLSSSVNGGNS